MKINKSITVDESIVESLSYKNKNFSKAIEKLYDENQILGMFYESIGDILSIGFMGLDTNNKDDCFMMIKMIQRELVKVEIQL